MDERALQSEFGSEAVLDGLWLDHLGCHGTIVATTITPSDTEAEALQNAWDIVRALAIWLLHRVSNFPANERFEIIVGWSRIVRREQGQIFKTGGSINDLLRIISTSTYVDFASSEHNPLRHNWQKNVL